MTGKFSSLANNHVLFSQHSTRLNYSVEWLGGVHTHEVASQAWETIPFSSSAFGIFH